MKNTFFNVCSMFIFSIRIINIKLNRLPIMEVIYEQTGLVRHYTNFGMLQNALLYL